MHTRRIEPAFLLDVDNTLIGNGRVIDDLECHLERIDFTRATCVGRRSCAARRIAPTKGAIRSR